MTIKPLALAACCLLGLTLGSPVFAQDLIRAFTVEASLSPTGEYKVHERLDYDVGSEYKHGIYRVIPRVAQIGWWPEAMGLVFQDAKMEGKTTPWKDSYGISNAKLKIGDPDQVFEGTRVFDLDYQIHRVIRSFPDHQELYWNVTGNAWEAPINQATFYLATPVKPLKAVCYTGRSGSTEHACTTQLQDHSVDVTLAEPLGSYEGLTVAVLFPPNSFAIPPVTFQERLLNLGYLAMNWIWLLLPLLALLVSFGWWWRRGRELRGRGTIIPQYEPPAQMTPALMDAVLHQSVSHRAISATILDLARRGYLKVIFPNTEEEKKAGKKEKTSVALRKLQEADSRLAEYEKLLFKGLFEMQNVVHPEDLKYEFFPVFVEIKKVLTKTMIAQKYMDKDPDKTRMWWMIAAFVWLLGSFQLVIVLQDLRYLVMFLGSIPLFVFGWYMPRLTKRGAERVEEIKGFKQFLSVTETERLAFHDAPAKTPEQFSLFLPAALALGVEKKWASQFAALGVMKPDYVEGGSAVQWSSSLGISGSFSSFEQSFSSSAFSSPSSGDSGGSSGGGSGGGGGGSW